MKAPYTHVSVSTLDSYSNNSFNSLINLMMEAKPILYSNFTSALNSSGDSQYMLYIFFKSLPSVPALRNGEHRLWRLFSFSQVWTFSLDQSLPLDFSEVADCWFSACWIAVTCGTTVDAVAENGKFMWN